MFERKKKYAPQKRIDCLIGAGTTVNGNVTFTGGLRVDGVVHAAMLSAGDGVGEPAGVAERAHERAAGGVDLGALMAVRAAQRRRGPGVELGRERAVARLEERPVEEVAVRAHHHFGAMRSPGRTSYGSPHPGAVLRWSRQVAR